jgi:hypothetical protein
VENQKKASRNNSVIEDAKAEELSRSKAELGRSIGKSQEMDKYNTLKDKEEDEEEEMLLD